MNITRFLYTIIITLCILSFASTSFATTSIETLTSQQFLEQSIEKPQVEQGINNSKFDAKRILVEYKDMLGKKNDAGANALQALKNTTELGYGSAYKVVIPDANVINALIKGTTLAPVLQAAPYQWEVPMLFQDTAGINSQSGLTPKAGALNNTSTTPTKTVAAFTVAKLNNNTWENVGFITPLSTDQIYFSSNANELVTFFKNASIKNADSIVHFRIDALRMDFFYVLDGKKEYFVPLIHTQDTLYGLKNMTVYNRNQIDSALKSIYKQWSSGEALLR